MQDQTNQPVPPAPQPQPVFGSATPQPVVPPQPLPPTQPFAPNGGKKPSKKGVILPIVVGLVVLLAFSGGYFAYAAWHGQSTTKTTAKSTRSSAATPKTTKTVASTTTESACVAGASTNICFKYPSGWTAITTDQNNVPVLTLSKTSDSFVITATAPTVSDGGAGPGINLNILTNQQLTLTGYGLPGTNSTGHTVGLLGGVANVLTLDSTSTVVSSSQWYPYAALYVYDGTNTVGSTASGIANTQVFTKTNSSAADNVIVSASQNSNSYYTTAADAEKAYNTADFQTAIHILESAYYK